MKERSFDSTPDFQRFKEVMRGVLKAPKTRLDELVREAERTHLEGEIRMRQEGNKSVRLKASQNDPYKKRSNSPYH